MSTWSVTYEDNQIVVENSWFGGERLWVNGALQDEQLGLAFRSRLYGSIRKAGHETKRIKVSIGTPSFSVECRIFVDDVLIFSGK
jgi:hypothetical protein